MKRLPGQEKSRIFPLFVIGSFCLTILAGFLGTLLPSLDFFPVIGHTQFSFTPWIRLFSYPGIKTSIFVTLFSGLTASFSAVILSLLFIAFSYGNGLWRFFEKTLAPVLSIPHAAFAIGYSFLIAPSGWIIRMVSPGLTDFNQPPDWVILNDPAGIALALAMVIKEFPFLIMVSMGALGQLDIERTALMGRAMGYEKEQIWLKILLPRLVPHLRLAIFAVIAYSFSVVDMAIILGPSSPPTLAVLILKWFNDPDVSFKLMAAAGSLFLFFMVCMTVGVAYTIEKSVTYFLTPWITNGKRSSFPAKLKLIIFTAGICTILFTTISSVILVIWSFTWQWRFPDFLPAAWTLKLWEKGLVSSFDPLMTTLLTGITAAFMGLILAIGCLEHDVNATKNRTTNFNRYVHGFLYLPLLVPQITFMSGIQLLLILMKMDGQWIALVWSHLLFVLPYIFIALNATYLAYDKRLTDQAMLLRRSYTSVLIRIKLPMLLRPILFSFAIGFSVSVAQYIPTMLVGAGRFSTITTEVVTLASGSDRRVIAVYALVQQALPMIMYALAIMVPKILYYKRKGMRV
jgi:putative thiamine transport system permease protein